LVFATYITSFLIFCLPRVMLGLVLTILFPTECCCGQWPNYMDKYIWTGTNAWTDCSLSHPAGHKPFTRSHCVRMCHMTYQLLLNVFFCSSLCGYHIWTDCSLSHPARNKPFTRSHCVRMYHVTYQLRLVLMRFSVGLSVYVFTTLQSLASRVFVQIRGVLWASSLSDELMERFSVIRVCFYHGKDKSLLVLRVRKCLPLCII